VNAPTSIAPHAIPTAKEFFFSDAALDAWLAQAGAATVGDLIERFPGVDLAGTVAVGFSAPPSIETATPRALPISAALMVRDAGFSVATLLSESKAVLEQLDRVLASSDFDASPRSRDFVRFMKKLAADNGGENHEVYVDELRKSERRR